jgi:glycerol-3-phosphate acyltransferase PlsY
VTVRVLAVLVGYLLGSVSFATMAARRSGADLRSLGSGNPGASNAGRVLGFRVGVAVAVLDVLKGLLPALVFGLLEHEAGLLAGVAGVLGHVTTPWLRGHGGKGVATAAGAILGSHPLWAPVALAVWLVVLFATRWIAMASVLAALTAPTIALVVGAPGVDVAWGVAIAVVIVFRHRSNFARWWRARQGSERRRQLTRGQSQQTGQGDLCDVASTTHAQEAPIPVRNVTQVTNGASESAGPG